MLDGVVPQYSDYLDAIFSDLVAAAGIPALRDRLRTADLADERKEREFARLRSLKKYGDGPIYLVSGGYLSRFTDGATNWVCVTSEQLTADERVDFEQWGTEEGFIAETIDETTFLFLTYTFRGLYRVKTSYLQREAAENFLDIGPPEPAPIVHDILGLIDVFESTTVFRIPPDSLYNTMSDFAIAARIAASHRRYRSPLIDDSVLASLSVLLDHSNINPENLYFALTASHWKYVFLEIYKVIEALFFLSWAMSVRRIVAYPGSAYKLAQEIRVEVPLARKELESMRVLFAEVPEAILKSAHLKATFCFEDIRTNADATSASYAERIYKVRNQLVHQLDYESVTPIEVTIDCWPKLVMYLSDIAVNLYSRYGAEADFDFALSADLVS